MGFIVSTSFRIGGGGGLIISSKFRIGGGDGIYSLI